MASLKGVKIIELREINDEEAKREILRFIKGGRSVYPSDIADALRIPLEQIFRIVNELLGEGKIEEA